MKIHADRSLSCLLITIAFIFASCFDSPISRYEPKNQDEREVISLLMQYQDARNNHDIAKLLSLLHDNGEFAFQCGRMVTKAVLKEESPGFWADIEAGNAAVFPIVHECINGDYYTTGEFNNPKIEIKNDTAAATVLFTKGISRVLLYFSMLRENNRWLITRTEWGDG